MNRIGLSVCLVLPLAIAGCGSEPTVVEFTHVRVEDGGAALRLSVAACDPAETMVDVVEDGLEVAVTVSVVDGDEGVDCGSTTVVNLDRPIGDRLLTTGRMVSGGR